MTTREQGCSVCGEENRGGEGSSSGDWFLCWECKAQGVESPPLPEAVQERLYSILARGMERRYREEEGVEVTVTYKAKDPTKRETWVEVAEREGGVAAAIGAIHRAKIDAGLARPLTRLLTVGEAAEAYGVTRRTFRLWLRGGKLRHLTQITPAGGGLLFREDEVQRDITERGKS